MRDRLGAHVLLIGYAADCRAECISSPRDGPAFQAGELRLGTTQASLREESGMSKENTILRSDYSSVAVVLRLHSLAGRDQDSAPAISCYLKGSFPVAEAYSWLL